MLLYLADTASTGSTVALGVVASIIVAQFGAVLLLWRSVSKLEATVDVLRRGHEQLQPWQQMVTHQQGVIKDHGTELEHIRANMAALRGDMSAVRDCAACQTRNGEAIAKLTEMIEKKL